MSAPSWSREDGGWIRTTRHEIEGTGCAIQLVQWKDDDTPSEDCAVVELVGDLPATPDNLRAAALTLLAIAD